MAITLQQKAEVLRKARNGLALTNPTKETTALYSSYKTPTTTVSKTNGISPVTGLKAGSVESAQAWINDPRSGQGGMNNYTADKQAKYEDAYRNNDTNMMSRLISDGKRAGYSLNAPTMQRVDAQDMGATGPNAMDLIRSSYENNLASQTQALTKLRDTYLQGLNGQETAANQNAYDNRNSADVVNAQNIAKLREMMAANGLSSSGDNISANVSLANDRQNAMNSINRDQSNSLQNISEQRSLINNNASADQLALVQQLQAIRDQNLVGQSNADRSYGLDLAGLSGKLPGGGQTLDSLRRNDANGQWQASFDYNKTRDTIADANYKKTFDENVRQFGITTAIDKAYKDKQISIDQYNAATSRTNATTRATPKTPKPVKYSYKTDPEFSKEISYVNGNANALSEVHKNSEALIKAYGYDGYKELESKATPKKK